jgi:hypothetical protein
MIILLAPVRSYPVEIKFNIYDRDAVFFIQVSNVCFRVEFHFRAVAQHAGEMGSKDTIIIPRAKGAAVVYLVFSKQVKVGDQDIVRRHARDFMVRKGAQYFEVWPEIQNIIKRDFSVLHHPRDSEFGVGTENKVVERLKVVARPGVAHRTISFEMQGLCNQVLNVVLKVVWTQELMLVAGHYNVLFLCATIMIRSTEDVKVLEDGDNQVSVLPQHVYYVFLDTFVCEIETAGESPEKKGDPLHIINMRHIIFFFIKMPIGTMLLMRWGAGSA